MDAAKTIKQEIANRELMIRNIKDGTIKSLDEIVIIEEKIIKQLEKTSQKIEERKPLIDEWTKRAAIRIIVLSMATAIMLKLTHIIGK